MASEQKGLRRLFRAETPPEDEFYFDMVAKEEKARQDIEKANIAHMQRKAGNDLIQQQINKNIAQFKPETDRLQKEKVRLQKELSKKRGAFRSAPSCNELQEQLIKIEQEIEIINKKILKAANLSEVEKSSIGYFGLTGGKKRRKYVFKKKRTKRRRNYGRPSLNKRKRKRSKRRKSRNKRRRTRRKRR